MNKTELVAAMAENSGLTKKDAEKAALEAEKKFNEAKAKAIADKKAAAEAAAAPAEEAAEAPAEEATEAPAEA